MSRLLYTSFRRRQLFVKIFFKKFSRQFPRVGPFLRTRKVVVQYNEHAKPFATPRHKELTGAQTAGFSDAGAENPLKTRLKLIRDQGNAGEIALSDRQKSFKSSLKYAGAVGLHFTVDADGIFLDFAVGLTVTWR